MNLLIFLGAAIIMVPLAKRWGAAPLHALCLVITGLGMIAMPHMTSKAMLFLPAIGIAGMDRALQANVIAKSGKAVEVAGAVVVTEGAEF